MKNTVFSTVDVAAEIIRRGILAIKSGNQSAEDSRIVLTVCLDQKDDPELAELIKEYLALAVAEEDNRVMH